MMVAEILNRINKKNLARDYSFLDCTSSGILLLTLISVIHTSFIAIVVSKLTRVYYKVIEK